MNHISHPELVKNLAKPGDKIIKEMSGLQAHLLHMSLGICGEAGELLDAIKKVAIYQKSIEMPNVIEELGDLEFYMEGLRQGLNISREECLANNINKLSKRYGEKYSNSAAQERKDKQ